MSGTEDPSFIACAADHADDLKGLVACLHADSVSSITSLASSLDTFFVLYAAALVFFMQTGFAMLTAGSVRAKNSKNVLLWNLLDSAGGGIAFWLTGWAFAYGGDDFEGPVTFVGNTGFLLTNMEVKYEIFLFQFAFACAVSSIVAGTVAERMQMRAYLFYSFFLVGFVYPVIAHAFWSVNGFLSVFSKDPLWGSGVLDLAGSGPVHMCGGVCALAAGLVLGPRRGRFYDKDGNPLETPNDIPPHSVSLQYLGTFALWFGWYGFNPGSVTNVSTKPEVAGLVAVNTTLAACSGALSAMFTSTIVDYFYQGYYTWDLAPTMNGCLTGLAAITAPCAAVETWAAVVIGIVSGWVYIGASKTLVRFRFDDAVDAVPVHMFGGAWGLLASGLFTTGPLRLAMYGSDQNIGWFYEWGRGSANFRLMACQLVGILFIFGWSFAVMGLYFLALNAAGALRVSEIEEDAGMDISIHKGACYDNTMPSEEAIVDLHNSRHGKKKYTVENGSENDINDELNEVQA